MNDIANAEKEKQPNNRPVVVGVGASAGGLEAFQDLVFALGENPDVAVVFVQHLEPNSRSLLPELLGQQTTLNVEEVATPRKIESNTVYVCPAQALLEFRGGNISVVRPTGEEREKNTIDFFLHSLAEAHGDRAVGVILSGAGSDGTLGLKAISDAGGMTFAQDAQSAKFDAMPRNAATTGVADHVLPPVEIAAELLNYVAHLDQASKMSASDRRDAEIRKALPDITEILYRGTGHNFKHYKTNTLCRRIQRRMQVLKLQTVADYVTQLQGDSDESQHLFRELLIGVTAFFRDPDSFERLAAEVIPKLFAKWTSNNPIRIWVPGCATGEEAYTMAILCREYLDSIGQAANQCSVQIFASDIDERALSIARQGIYPAGISDHVSPTRLKKFFIKKSKRYHVVKEIREMVLFSPHNLISDPPFSRQDLISCRNLLIYLGPHLQKKLIPLFHFALRPNGFLFLGPSESTSTHGDLFRSVDSKHRISQRKGTTLGRGVPGRGVPIPLCKPADVTSRLPAVSPVEEDRSDVVQIMQRIVLDEFAPKSVVIDEDGQVICASAETSKYLSIGDGTFENNIVKMARRGLRIGLRATLSEAKAKRRRVVHENLSVQSAGGKQRVMITVQPMMRLGEESGLFIVVFHDVGLPMESSVTAPDEVEYDLTRVSIDRQSEEMIQQLERELATTRADLEKMMQEMETANAELKSSNEELLSMNEELQSANEELETSKEEIRAGSEAISRANDDLENLLRSTQIATIFLDEDGHIRSFTPAATEIYSLIATDLGRPLENFVPAVKDMPALPDPESLAADVPVEHTVFADNGRVYIRRVLRYQSRSGELDGMVVTFSDVTDLKQSQLDFESSQRQLRTLTDAIPPLMAIVDRDQRFTFVNKAYADRWQKPVDEIVGRTINEVVSPNAYEAIEPNMKAALSGEQVRFDLELIHPSTEQPMYEEAVYVPQLGADHVVEAVHIVITDQTENRLTAKRLADAKQRLELSLEVADIAPWNWDMQTNDVVSNAMLNRLFGFENDATPGLADFLARTDESIRDRISAALERSMSSGAVYDEEYPITWPDGEVRHVRARGYVRMAEDGTAEAFFGVVLDITQRKRQELELADKEAHLRRVINNQLGLVGLVDRDGILVEVDNRSLEIAHASQVLDPTLLASKSKLAYLDLVYEYKMDFHEFLTDTKTNEEEQKAKKEAEKKATEDSLNSKPSEN